MKADPGDALRKLALKHLEQGCYGFMRAFDLTGEGSTWEFDIETRRGVERMLFEVVGLFHREGGIRPKAKYIAELRALGARNDAEFQRFLINALGKPINKRRRRCE